MLTLLTATGARPVAWAICEQLMAAQQYASPVRWIIVDDGPEPQPIVFARRGWTIELVRPTPFWKSGQNTQARNLLAGLARVDDAADRVAIIEDDDHYAPSWLLHVDGHLDGAELVGETCARYYNVAQRRARQLRNIAHASLCATALRGRAIAELRRACEQTRDFIDLMLWRSFHGAKHLFGGHRVTGIKGLPGRAGVGMGHRAAFKGNDDPHGDILRQWIGVDAEMYL